MTQLTSRGAARPATDRSRADLGWFAALTLLLSWGPLAVTVAAGRTGDVWFVVGTSGPTLAALLLWLAGRRRPRGPVRPVLARAWVWLPAALGLGLLPALAAAVLTPVLGGPALDPSQPARLLAGVGGLAPALVMVLLAGPLAEEFGWRGYAQPRLRRFLGPVATSAVLGTAWAAWHLPLFLVEGTSQHELGLTSVGGALFLLSFLPLTYVFWFVSERLGGGVVSAVLLHAAFNAGSTFLRIESTVASAVVLLTATACALAVGAVTRAGRPVTTGTDARVHPGG